MAQGVSIHIGVDYVDSKHYGTRAQLPFCENDARVMYKIAEKLNYRCHTFFNERATAAEILYKLQKEATSLRAGDILLLTFSGHGGVLKDLNGDERDNGHDETWVLYDRMLVDDEIFVALSRFKVGVRIVVISDSCHSGTVIKEFDSLKQLDKQEYMRLLNAESDLIRKKNKFLYDSILKSIAPGAIDNISASAILLAACQDNQHVSGEAPDGKKLSLFTSYLLETWNGGNFSWGYRHFYEIMKKKMPRNQMPNYLFLGRPDSFFENQKPFTI